METNAALDLRHKKLALLVACAPSARNFAHALGLAEAALRRGLQVYFYCLDQAVLGARLERVQALRARGLKLFVCALGAQHRGIPFDESAVYSGLTVVNEMAAFADRFLTFG